MNSEPSQDWSEPVGSPVSPQSGGSMRSEATWGRDPTESEGKEVRESAKMWGAGPLPGRLVRHLLSH